MRKLLVLGTAAVLCATGAGAEAAPKAKPLALTYFFHGTQQVGELDPLPVMEGFRSMDKTAPSGSQSKSQFVTNYVGGPNTACAGNTLFPVWVGSLSGDVSGPMTFKFSAFGSGGSVLIRVFADVEALACNDDLPKVAGTVTATAPSGQGKLEATIKSVKLKAKSSFMVQLSPTGPLTPDQTRVFYDSATDNSSVSFSCLPKPGKKAC